MQIKINIDRNCELESSRIGTQNENEFEKLEFVFPEELEGYAKTIEVQTIEGKFVDKIENNEYIIKNNITKYKNIKVQIVAIKYDTVFKSKVFELKLWGSINATEQIVEEKPDLINKMLVDIEKIEKDISNFSEYDDTKIKEDITDLQNNKVNKEEGKGLSSNDYTDEEKEKLANLQNYDDTQVKADITAQGKKIEAIQEEQETQNTDIESLQAENESIKQENARLKKDIQANQITDTAEGESLALTDCSSARLVDFEISGNSRQATRSGKNLFDKTKIVEGFRIGAYNGGELYAEEGYFASNYIEIMPNTIYTVNYKMSAYTRIAIFDENKEFIKNNTTDSTFTTPTNAKYLRLGNTLETLDTIQLEEGEVATFYEPYGAMPSPDYPSEVESCGDNINIVPTTADAWEQGTISNGVLIDSKTRIRSKDYIEIKEETYVYSVEKNKILNIWYFDENKNFITNSYNITHASNLMKFIIKTPATVKYFKIVIAKESDITIIPEDIIDTKLKIEKGTTATPYSPYNQGNINIIRDNNENKAAENYQSKIYTVPVQKPFRAIGDVRDTFVKQDGKWYEKHNINRYVITGNEDISNPTASEKTRRFDITINNIKLTDVNSLSNMFKTTTFNNRQNDEIQLNTHINQFMIRMDKNKYSTVPSSLKYPKL